MAWWISAASGVCVDLRVSSALETETEAAKQMLARQAKKRVRRTTLGADKDYHCKDFVAHLRKKEISPHIAQIEGRRPRDSMRAPRGMRAMGSASARESVSAPLQPAAHESDSMRMEPLISLFFASGC